MNNSPEMSVGSDEVKSLQEQTQDVLDSQSPPLSKRADLTRSFLKKNGMDQAYVNKLAQVYDKPQADLNDDKALTTLVVAMQADSGLLDIQQDGILGPKTKEAMDHYMKMTLSSLDKVEGQKLKATQLKTAEAAAGIETEAQLRNLDEQLANIPQEDLSSIFNGAG